MMPHRSNSQLLIWWSTLLRRKWKGTGAENVIWYILYYLSCLWFDERYILTVVHFQSSNCGVDSSEKNFSMYEINKTYHGNYLNDFYSRVAMHQKLTRSLRSLVGSFDALQLMNIIVRTHDGIIYIVIYLDFHSTKWVLWLVDSWSRAPDHIQMYLDRDTIA